jgi:hypothetical protein
VFDKPDSLPLHFQDQPAGTFKFSILYEEKIKDLSALVQTRVKKQPPAAATPQFVFEPREGPSLASVYR